jgi:hypothetical protein
MDNFMTDDPVVIVERPTRYGLWGCLIGLIGIFFLSPILSPIAIILGLIGIFRLQIFSSLFAIIFAIIGILTSPIIMGLIGLSVLVIPFL